MPLSKKKCVPCEGDATPLSGDELITLQNEVGSSWRIINEHHLEKEYKFKDFKEALEFTNRVGELAEKENHHPDIHLSYGRVRIILWTHAIGGLSENDFIVAAKCDELLIKKR